MCDYNYMENYIADFVDRHVSEKVYLQATPTIVTVQPVRKRGSILLAMFWVKVLQHKDNFPPQSVCYSGSRRQRTSPNSGSNVSHSNGSGRSELISISVEAVTISVHLLTGALLIEGPSALDWFQRRIMDIVGHYVGLKDNTRRSLHSGDRSAFSGATESCNHRCGWPNQELEEMQRPTVIEEEHLSNLMMDSVLDMAMENVRQSTLKPANQWIYRFWKSLLYKWSSDANTKIVIATSQIDPTRLQDIADISLLLRATSQILAVYLPHQCDVGGPHKTLAAVKSQTLVPYNPQEQLWIEYEIFHRIVVPANGIGCNFVAGIMPANRVQLMVTSCRFHGVDIDRHCVHSVQFVEMSELQFDRDFISPLQSQ